MTTPTVKCSGAQGARRNDHVFTNKRVHGPGCKGDTAADRAEAGAGPVGEHDTEEFRCPSCGNTTFQAHGRTSYTQRVVLKANQAGAVSLDEDDDCGGWGDRTSYPDGDVLAGVECCRCLAEIETLDEHLQPDDLKPAVREHAKLNSFLQQHHRAGEQGAAAVTIPITAGLHDYLVERRDTLRTVIDARHASA